MDYLSHAAALRAIVNTIEQDVIGRVDDAYARSQLWSATGILANVARELDESSADRDNATLPCGHDTHDAATTDVAACAATLLDSVRADVAAQKSLHYRKATTGGR